LASSGRSKLFLARAARVGSLISGVRRQLLTWGVFSLGLLLASSACGYLVRAMNPRPQKYSRYPGVYSPAPPAGRTDLVNRAAPTFGRAMPPTPADVAAFAPLFDVLAAATRAGDGQGVVALWNCDRAAEEVWAQVALWTGTVPTYQQVSKTAWEVRETLAGQGRDPAFRFDRAEVLKVSRSRNGRDAQVVVRHTATAGGVTTVYCVRWWLVLAPGDLAWRVYDRDDPRSRLPMTVRRAGHEWQTVAGGSVPGGVPSRSPIEAVENALELPLEGSVLELDSALSDCRGANLPRPWAAARAVAEANLHIRQGEPQKALKSLDFAAQQDPAFPRTRLVRAAAANRLGDHKTALQNADIYRDAVGPDPDAVLQIGLALEATERSAPAVREYRAALKDFPGHDALYPALARALPAGQQREAGELAANGPQPADHLRAILSAPEADDLALADEVVAGFLAARPDDPHGLAAAAVVRVRQGRLPEAAALLRQAREVTPGDVREAVRLSYLSGVLRHGVPVAGYNAVPPADRSAAFRWLAGSLQVRGPQLELIAAHRAAVPSDPWGAFWLAELFASRGRPEPAEELLAAAMTKLPKPTRTTRKAHPDKPPFHSLSNDELTWDQFRTLRTMYLLKLGRWKDAYRGLPPAVDTFDQLAHALDKAGDAAGRAELIGMHRTAAPDDAEAIFWRGRVHWLRKETEQAVGLFTEYRKASGAVQKWRADEGRVRGLVRLGRADEARQVLEGSDVVAAVLPLRALVAAAAGDAEWLARELAGWADRGAGPREFYADPDLGPLLRGDRFADVRAKYPPP
jgi:tetratricopeptide (TPR) repeat protein